MVARYYNRRKWGAIANGYSVSFGSEENVLGLDSVDSVQFLKFT